MEERESFINLVSMASEGLGKITVIAQQLPLDSLKEIHTHTRDPRVIEDPSTA